MPISLTRAQLAHRVYSLAVVDVDSVNVPVTVPDVEDMIDVAVDRLCDRVVNSPKYFYLQTSQTVSVSAGTGALTAGTYVHSVLPSHGGHVALTGITHASYVSTLRDLTVPKAGSDASSSDIGYWTVRGNGGAGRLYVYTAAGAAWTGTATVLACTKQTFSTLVAELEEELIAELYSMVIAKIRSQLYASA